MLKLFKNLFSLKRFSKATIISIVLFSIVLGLILPVRPVHAGWEWWEKVLAPLFLGAELLYRGITEGAGDIAVGLIGGVFQILVAVTGVFAFASHALLNWFMSPGFINVSFTGQDNVFVTTGWRIIRDLTNIAIVLGLVFIALATILRISTYHAKKTLPLLLIVALLVNFSPVICGIIIDASNIVMNYFLKAGALDASFLNKVVEQLGELGRDIEKGENPAEALGKGVVFVGFNIGAGIIFLLFAFLFLFRYIALWILVILSPLAFFCYVFPYTRKWWDMWWKQFLAWCFIGIPAAFSIFLANRMIGLIATKQLIGEVPGGALSPTSTATIMGYIIPLAFLAGGFLISLQTGAIGANIAIKGFQWTKGKAWGATKWLGKGTGAGIAGAARGVREEKGLKGKLKGIGKGLFSYEGHEKGREATAKMLEAAHLVRPGFYEETRRKRWKLDEEIKRMEKASPDELHRIMERVAITPADVATKTATFEALSKKRELKEEERKFITTAKTYGANVGETLKAMPHWAADVGKEVTKQVAGRSPRQFRQETQPSALEDFEVFKATDIAKMRDIMLRGTSQQKEALNKGVTGNFTKLDFEIEKFRRSIAESERKYAADLARKVALIKGPGFRV